MVFSADYRVLIKLIKFN